MDFRINSACLQHVFEFIPALLVGLVRDLAGAVQVVQGQDGIQHLVGGLEFGLGVSPRRALRRSRT